MSQLLVLGLLAACLAGCASTDSAPRQGVRSASVPILMYHHVNDLPSDADEVTRTWTVSRHDFETQMKWLLENEYHPVTLVAVADHLSQGVSLPSHPIVLTFDDGWDIGYSTVFPTLRKAGFVGTFFVYASGIDAGNPGGYMSWDQLREMDQAGMEIASHTLTHPSLPGMPVEAQQREIAEPRRTLERCLGHQVFAFAYPFGKFDATTQQLVQKAGYRCAVGIEPGWTQRSDDLFAMRRIRVSYGDTLDTFKELVRG